MMDEMAKIFHTGSKVLGLDEESLAKARKKREEEIEAQGGVQEVKKDGDERSMHSI